MKRSLVYCLSLSIGACLALLVVPRLRAAEAHDHDHGEERANRTPLSPQAEIHDQLSSLAESLEDGTTDLARVLDVTTMLFEHVQMDVRDSKEEVRLPLTWHGTTFGHLRVQGMQADGKSQWVFDLALPALERHEAIAAPVPAPTELSITYQGTGTEITLVAALVQTLVHTNAKTMELLGDEPRVIGGCLAVSESGATWKSLALKVEVPEDTGIPLWTSGEQASEPREDSLGAADYQSVAAILFSM